MQSAPLNLVYFADPMCSWCYGFAPELMRVIDSQSRDRAVKLDLVMGGLRAYQSAPLDDAQKEALLGHWKHVAETTGLPFDDAALRAAGFVYDTEPACRAVVTARHHDAAKAPACLKAVQRAFYRDGRDVTSRDELADIAAENGFDRDTFLLDLDSDRMRAATRADFARTQSLGVVHGSQVYLVTSGYATDDVLEYRLAEIGRLVARKAASG